MESKVLQEIKKNYMKDRILSALKPALDESYNQYMRTEYPKELKAWEEDRLYAFKSRPYFVKDDEEFQKQYKEYDFEKDPLARNGRKKPEPRQKAEVLLDKISLYLEKLRLAGNVQFVFMLHVYEEITKVILYLLTQDGVLIKLETRNGAPPKRVDYIVNRDISRIELDSEDKTIDIYSYNRKWERAEVIQFKSEDAAYDFYCSLSDFRNRTRHNKYRR